MIRTADGTISVTPVLPGVLQVTVRCTPEAAAPPSWAVLPQSPVSVALRATGEGGAFAAGDLHGRLQGARLTVAGVAMTITREGGSLRVACAAAPDDRFYGAGQRGGDGPGAKFERSGDRLAVWHEHSPPPSNMVLPFLVSRRGYGLLFDHPGPAHFDLSDVRPGEGGEWRYTCSAPALTFYFISGRGLAGVLDNLTRLTGRPSLFPLWSLGLLQSKFGYRNRAEAEELAHAFRARGIPCDGIVLDLFWFRSMGDLCFDEAAFPRPAEMIAELRRQGFRVMVIEEPYLLEGSRLRAEAAAAGYVARDASGEPACCDIWCGPRAMLVDYSNPAARRWWAAQQVPLVQAGISGFWVDLNEPEVHPPHLLHAGGTAAAVHNLQAIQMIDATWRGWQAAAPGRRPFLLSRSGWPGMQRYGATTWSGDVACTWEALAAQPALALNTGLCGIPGWSSDIGGFRGPAPSAELYVRWLQFGVFSPICRPHCGLGQQREPWAFGPVAEGAARTALALRYRLLPYTYTLAWESSQSGLPMMRPLVLAYPDDPQTWDVADAYLWGDALLVAPVLQEGATARRVYLPDGDWYDWHTGQRYRGGGHVALPAPLERIPLLARAGAIVPLGAVGDHAGPLPWDPLTLRVYPGDGQFTLFEDDGESSDAPAAFTVLRHQAGALEASGGPLRRWRLEIWRERPPARLWLDGAELPGWQYDAATRLLSVELPRRSAAWRVAVEG